MKRKALPYVNFGRVLCAALLCSVLFTACTEDPEVIASLGEEAAPQQIIQLAPRPDKWVTIHASKEEELEDLSKKRRATQAGGPDRGRFNISLKFIVPVTEEQERVFNDAAARWECIIIKDVPSITGTIPSAFVGFPPAADGTVDDFIIEVALAPIDGPGGILGQAGPVYIRNSDNLPLSGVMFFDVDDLAFLDELGLFEEVIIHEMGHVLGVGTLWDYGDRDLLRGEETNPYYAGKLGNIFWKLEGGRKLLPVEDTGGPGTALGHWRESVLGNELMTGFLNLGENPLSHITAASMRDLGYGAIPFGERYDLERGTPGVDPNDENTTPPDIEDPAAGIDLAAREITLRPIGSVEVK
ncbi:leishmanolysin-related zinc metalloendopeptidase [Lewinella sp. IMCC34191]|uniref:leishmanolysin-related zinc metalloendopeptidase n=1 Tax=Lewinella sp. IMCC34191 TaxID=2259172 RepID=UPI000E23E5A5|nr:leishmanolysin-related zinc metalloendopeptidase [Lewinella sp. IMCC34191]